MPMTRAWLAAFRVEDNNIFNGAIVSLMAYFAKAGHFFEFFEIGVLIQLIELASDFVSQNGIDVLLDIIQSRTIPSDDFLPSIFRFLFVLSFSRDQFFQYKIVRALTVIARSCESRDGLWEIAVANCPFQNELLHRFLSVVIHENPVFDLPDTVDQFYKFILTNGRTSARFE
jgi:hypothetical protein